jgi:hypothetical protein
MVSPSEKFLPGLRTIAFLNKILLLGSPRTQNMEVGLLSYPAVPVLPPFLINK